MKKTITIIMLAVLIFSCKSKSGATATTVKNEPVTSTKLDRSSQVAIKGNWVITSVTFPGSDYIRVSSFNIADTNCFVGSTWNFISNNNKGSMSLTKTDCLAFSSPIVWSINKEGVFVLKIVEAGVKSKTVTQGFLLRVANQTENSFQLIDKINVGGQDKEVTYQFVKIISTKN
ncbi:lipocalin family protein [Flavobacterium sp.]|uniref:lipocalin family protein n=1 Tax=Flavobacterium sp. TaxID=239 RepID=UPI00286E314D|nr:lipocalin family protein [Flavobacterium sp.]